METPKHAFLSPLVQFVLVMGGLMGIVALVAGYGTFNPNVFGHTSDEVQYTFVVQNSGGCSGPFCTVSCSVGSRALHGRCMSDNGYQWASLGVGPGLLGGSEDLECIDLTLPSSGVDGEAFCWVVN